MMNCVIVTVTHHVDVVGEDTTPSRHDAVLEDEGHHLLQALGLVYQPLC